MSVQASLTYFCPFNVCTCGDCLRLSFVMKNRRFFLLLLLRIPCFALQFFCHDGHSDVLAEACFCTNRRMGIICILMFFFSYVFIILCFVLSLALYRHWDQIPGPGQGWHCCWCLRCFVGVWECVGGCEGSWCLFWALGNEFLRARKFCCEGSEFAKRGFAR